MRNYREIGNNRTEILKKLNRNIIPLLLIFSIISNIFISLHHFGSNTHKINPETGTVEHCHDCENEIKKPELAGEGYLPEKKGHHENSDICNALNVVFKQSLQVETFAPSAPEITAIFYKNYYSDCFQFSTDILSFAPKNSPPVV